MSVSLHPTRREALLQTVEKATPAKAKVGLQELENAGRFLRKAIGRLGLTPKEASGLVDVNDASQFNRMLDGIERLDVHRLLTKKARPLLREMLILVLLESGECEVERTIRIKEAL